MWNQSSYSRKLPLCSLLDDVPNFIYHITLSIPCLLLERYSIEEASQTPPRIHYVWGKDCYDDAITSDERFVYKYLQKITLSAEAHAELDYATKLARDSFKYRDMFNDDFPDYQINNWDCSYYQLKMFWKEYMPKELAEFRALYSKLTDKMRTMVYQLGFIRSYTSVH